ncbi:hypothetical protein GS982_01685 [Rhodococcus hoagii]|uniref:Uncharacterized protein n=1 Tax=Rhodococcus hoagii TaxID=43767 RepID=A0A9Q5EVT8_RHOHA|nr:hypothetical protein [Prescottella equi]NKT77309.1 hypothetical protein [Prescottella equi]NKZ81096.1 hypothetical protein [Prescottella equi]
MILGYYLVMALLFLAVSCVQLRNAAIPNGAKIIGVPVALLCAFGWPLMMLVALVMAASGYKPPGLPRDRSN